MKAFVLVDAFMRGVPDHVWPTSGTVESRGPWTKGRLWPSWPTDGLLLRKAIPGATVARADMAGAKLHHADLSGANFTHAVLDGANLWRANLDGSIGADLSGATLDDIVTRP
jgi:hypothetical protein